VGRATCAAETGQVSKRFHIQQAVVALDGTSFPKKGTASVGVAPQYYGALGKVANCQSVVTLEAFIAGRIHFPIAAQLYLPKAWTEPPERLEKARVSKDYQTFQEKWRIAMPLLDTAELPFEIECLVFDAGYGKIRAFLVELGSRHHTFIGQIPESHRYWSIDVETNNRKMRTGRPRQYPEIAYKTQKADSAAKWEQQVHQWRQVQLTSGAVVQAARFRVREVTTQAYFRPGAERWLVIEKLEDGTIRYWVSNASASTSLRQLVTWAHQRWTIEQSYQQLKEELGLAHFEGRSWPGLNHHLVLCFMAYCFLLLWRRTKRKSMLTLPLVRRVILNALSLLACPHCQRHLSHLSWNTT
jgi:SRSO17 transposase